MDKSSFLLFLITTVWISQAIACDSDCLLRWFCKHLSKQSESQAIACDIQTVVIKKSKNYFYPFIFLIQKFVFYFLLV